MKGSTLIPRDRLSVELSKLDREGELVIVCRTGRRSARVVAWLREVGFTRARNLDGGLTAWSTDIDPQLPVY